MDEEFIFQVTEEELAQFPEEGDQSQEEQSPLKHQQELESKEKCNPGNHRKTRQGRQQGKDTFTIES